MIKENVIKILNKSVQCLTSAYFGHYINLIKENKTMKNVNGNMMSHDVIDM